MILCGLLAANETLVAQNASGTASAPKSTSAARVLQVGSYHGKAGAFSSIQAAVNAAKPGDWILIGPGDYHEQGSKQAGVWVTTPGLHFRGMDRNGVVVDGTLPGSSRCSADPADQDFGSAWAGRNGIEIYKTDGVSVENLTVCNFMGDAYANNGNQIWWNGGDGTGHIGLGRYYGAFLTASSTFYQSGTPNVAQYGIFISNSKGPGSVLFSYASNMGDSAFYIGGCPDCNASLRFVHAQNSPQGYSGSNSGGHLVIEDSEWDHNQSGIVPSSLASYDPPSPQDGACPEEPGKSCTLIQRNYVHDNNNPNTPGSGLAATAVVGSGIDLSGGRHNTVRNNLVINNGSWGILLNDYPDFSPVLGSTYCDGGIIGYIPPPPFDQLYGTVVPCFFHSYGNHVERNWFDHYGFFGNDTNGDLANAAIGYRTNNCFRGNVDFGKNKATSSPSNLQDPDVAGICGKPWKPDTSQEFSLIDQLGCASLGPASGACAGLSGPLYPLPTQVQFLPIPREPGMDDPCDGVPENSWCEER